MKITEILRGPASLAHDGMTQLATDDVNAQFISEFSEINSSAFGVIRRPYRDARVEVSCSPMMYASLTKLFPYETLQVMDSLYGATPKALVVTPRNGRPLTVKRSMPTKLSSVKYSTSGSMLGPMTWTGLISMDEDGELLAADDKTSWYTLGDPASNVAMAGYDLSKITNDRYTLKFDGKIYEPDEGGFMLERELAYEKIRGDNTPTCDLRFVSLISRLRFVPIRVVTDDEDASVGEDQYLAGHAMGTNIGDDAPLGDAVVSGSANGKLRCSLKNAEQTDAKLVYGRAARQGEIVLQNIRTVTANALTAPVIFDTVS